MKLFNLFKKELKNVVKSNTQKLEKNQLSKVIGGADATDTSINPEKKGINAMNLK